MALFSHMQNVGFQNDAAHMMLYCWEQINSIKIPPQFFFHRIFIKITLTSNPGNIHVFQPPHE